MPLDSFIAGRCTLTYGGSDCGPSQQGWEIQQDSGIDPINETDAWGLSMVDWVYRGGNVFVMGLSKTYKTGTITSFWPYAVLGDGGVIGRLASDIAQAAVLTGTPGTPASGTSETATLSLLAPNSPASILYDSRVRNMPIRFQVLYDGTSWFV